MPEKPQRLIRIRETEARTGLKRTSIYQRERRGEFPKRVALSPYAFAHVEAEVDAWIAARMAARQEPQPERPRKTCIRKGKEQLAPPRS